MVDFRNWDDTYGWIPADSEEKPNEAEDILCYCRYYSADGDLITEAHEIMRYHKNSGFSGAGRWPGINVETCVVSWRHLPEPPKEDEL